MARKEPSKPEPTLILRRKQVEVRTGLSRSTIYSRIQQKQFPAPINLGGRAVGWLQAEVDEWLDRQVRRSREMVGVAD
jgi:prophage regulatory protein